MVHGSILDAVGETPVVYLQRFSEAIGVKAYAKLESLNPGGSHKIRIALGMIKDAEKRGILKPGSGQTLIEPSGGNTGIGLAMAANLHGYKLKLVIPDNYSPEKQQLLKLYGADIILSDSMRGNNSHGEKAWELVLEHPDYIMLNQQRNAANPQTHYRITSREIIRDFESIGLDAFVAGIGTGGHLSGIGAALKDVWPDYRIFGVEPAGCDLLNDIHAPHDIQGLSVGLIPDNLNCDLIDEMVRVTSDECREMCKTMLRLESISMGLSSAGNFVAIRKLASTHLEKGAVVLALVYDGLESYSSEIAA